MVRPEGQRDRSQVRSAWFGIRNDAVPSLSAVVNSPPRLLLEWRDEGGRGGDGSLSPKRIVLEFQLAHASSGALDTPLDDLLLIN
jgi:hypothetical protein